jgi:ERCC4-type nuclease
MFIKIDSREEDLKTTMNLLFKHHSHDIISESLPVGDIILMRDNIEKIIFERKSLYDLASSIKDGRYSEQSFRLNSNILHNHNIIYIIEGDFEKYNSQKGRIDKKTLYSALITLNYYKGFSVIRTKNINETAELIINFSDKLEKESKKEPFYNSNTLNNEDTNTLNNEDTNTVNNDSNNKHYCEVMKKHKKNNITPDNIGEIMLSNIPGVSSRTAICIMKQYVTIQNLIKILQDNDCALDNIKIQTENGLLRKISKTSVINIKKFMLP